MLLDEIVKVENYGQERAKKRVGDINTDTLMLMVKENLCTVGD